MEISLKKARKLESAIANYITTSARHFTEHVISVSPFEEITVETLTTRSDEGLNAAKQKLDDLQRLQSTRFFLRQNIDNINIKSGIRDLMLQKNRVDDERAMFANFEHLHARVESVEVFYKRLMAIASSWKHESYGGGADIQSFSVLDLPFVEGVKTYKKNLDAKSDDIQERLDALNLTKKVKLLDEDVERLNKHGLL